MDNQILEEVRKLHNDGLSDYKIAELLSSTPNKIYYLRKKNNINRGVDLRYNKAILLSQFQKEVLIGTMLGDASFKKGKDCKNPAIQCAHGIKQKEYCEYKTNIFKSLGAECKYHIRNVPDKRNGMLYEDYTMYIPANPEFTSIYNSFYTPKKQIPSDLSDFTEVSLAFMYMDDGNKMQNGYSIATMCFSKEDIKRFRVMLLEKFNLETSEFSDGRIYIQKKSAETFKSLVLPYICNSMLYKI